MYSNTGTCRFCGQMQTVMATTMLEQCEADRIATDRCTCNEARTVRELDEAMDRLRVLTLDPDCAENGFLELVENERVAINQMLEWVVRQLVSGVQITLICGDKIDIKHGAGRVKLQRKKSVQREV